MKVMHVTSWVMTWWSLQLGRVVTESIPKLKCPLSVTSCQIKETGYNFQEFKINDQRIVISYGDYIFRMDCYGKTALDSTALPVFTNELRVNHIDLFKCLLPGNGRPILRALAALNVTLQCDTLCKMQLTLPQTSSSAINVSHFAGLEPINALELKNLTVAPDFLITMPRLRILEVFNMTLDIDAVSSSLSNLTIWHWDPQHGTTPISRCKALLSLEVFILHVSSLPIRWLAACSRLQVLKLLKADKIKQLSHELLSNATELIEFQFKGKLEELPYDIFYHSPKLQIIRLSDNLLKTLPSQLFVNSVALRVLDLSKNKLNTSALEAFITPSLNELLELNLGWNPTLQDLCKTSQGYSKLSSLEKLEVLSLEHNNITCICRDWRTKMHLKDLKLKYTQISRLQRKDMEFDHAADVLVNLRKGPVSSVQFDEVDYHADPNTVTFGNVSVILNDGMKCDCNMYWTWRALRDGHWPENLHVRNPMRCKTKKGSRYLTEMTEVDLMCVANASECGLLPDECTCAVRPADGGSQHLRVSCEGTDLTAIPTELRSITTYSVDLLLAHNNISYMHLDELPPKLKKLDISNNTIQALDIKTVTSLVGEGRTLNISSNPLTCSCEHKDMLEMLFKHIDTAVHTGVTCAGGEVLAHVILECNPSVPLGIIILGTSLAAFLAVTFAVVACLVRRNTRLYAAVLLDRLGLLRWRNDADDDLLYDVFVSFSHGDEKFLLEIVKWLEDRSPPYRLCLHYRDWVPGRSIAEQISESVMSSRRTLALVSTNFLNSNWARAEFREAHAYALRDVTRRLVVVLLQDKDSLELDAELRRYLAVNTYLQWGDTWFWDKLKLALPRPRPRSPPSSPSLSRAVPLPLLSIDAVPLNDSE